MIVNPRGALRIAPSPHLVKMMPWALGFLAASEPDRVRKTAFALGSILRLAEDGYKGAWEHPQIPNPDYVEDPDLYMRCKDCTHIGFELWQVKSGTMIDDIIVTDSLDEAKAFAQETFFKKQAGEKEAYDAAEEEKKAKAKEMADKEDEEDEEDEEEDHDEL